MARIESWFTQDLTKPVQVHGIAGNLFSADNQGNLIGVEVFDNGEPVTLSGTVTANVIRPDGGTVAVSGSYTGNKASVVLPAAAYAIPGQATICIKITDSNVVTTLTAVVVTIYRSTTDTVVDPGTIIPSIQTLISQIQTAVSSIPADYSSLWTTLAPAYSTSSTYAVGQYVTYNGKMYRCVSAISSGESWTSAHWSEVKIGNELSDLKSAFNNLNGYVLVTPDSTPENYRLKNDGNAGSNTKYKLLKYSVTQGQRLYVNVTLGGTETNDRALQFQDRESVTTTGNTSHVVGTPIETSYSGFVTVPTGATWLVLSILKTDGTSGVNVYTQYDEIQKNALSGKTAANAIVRMPDAISTGWYIQTSGRCKGDANMRLCKYAVIPGETVYINALKISGFNVVYHWQNAQETPSIYSENPITRVGDPVLVDTLAAVVVPEGATWIVFNDTVDGHNGLMGASETDVYADKIAAARVNHIKKTGSESYAACDMSAMVVTDLHNQADRTQVMANLVNRMGSLVDVWVNCGDTVYNLNSEDLTWYNDIMSDLEVPNLNVIGNHDAYVTNGAYGDKADAYQNIIAPLASQTGIVQPTGASENNLCYYYYDVNTVRIICLDYVYWDASEASWLESVLADALTNELAVVCVSHCGFGGEVSEHIKSVWREVDVATSGKTNIAAAEKVAAFIQNGGEFVCWLVGHTHGDNLHKLPDYQNQMVVTFASPVQRAAYLQKSDVATDYNYTIGTYMCVDRYYKTAKFLRIGADIDEWGIKHNGVALNYDTKTLIAAW